MADAIVQTKEISLGEEGPVVRLRPLPIKPLREFMKLFEESKENESEAEALDRMFDAAALAILFLNQNAEPAITKEALEEVLDLPTILKVLEVAGGMDFSNPNLTSVGVAGTI